jgi:KDO2-lipid IV(A) lauroyltransferase
MDWLLYIPVLLLIKCLQALPLRVVARIGRAGGAVAYWLDPRHRRVALRNLEMCLGGEFTKEQLRSIAKENFRRLGENYASAVKTAAMTWDQLKLHLEFAGIEKIYPTKTDPAGTRRVVAIGHFGNFELYGRFGDYLPGVKGATTYRALRQPGLNRLMQAMREQANCLFFERRTQAEELRAAMNSPGIMLGLLVDQHANTGGVIVPFFGKECSTSASAAVFALRYDCPLHTGICYRTGLARWRVEGGDEIPTRVNGQARSIEDITRDVNRAFEAAVRRDPANWFWVHNRWKTPKKSSRAGRAKTAVPQPAQQVR